MDCNHFDDLFESYVLDELDGAEREALEEHLGSGCEVCPRELHRASVLNAEIFGSVARLDPAAGLRARILAGFGIEARPLWARTFPWAGAAFSTVAAVLKNVSRVLEAGVFARVIQKLRGRFLHP